MGGTAPFDAMIGLLSGENRSAKVPGPRTTGGHGEALLFPHSVERSPNLEQVFCTQKHKLVQYLRIRLGNQAEAEDAAQSAFVRLHARQEQLHDDNLTALLYVTARNIANDLLRQRSRMADRHIEVESEAVGNIPDDGVGAERVLGARQEVTLVLRIVGELSEKCRASFIWYRFHDIEYAEIAARLGVTESMARKYVLKATAHCARRFADLEKSA